MDADERAGDGARASIRSIDYLMRGERAKENAHLRAFASGRLGETLCRKMQEDDNYSSWARIKGKVLRKEITEAVACVSLVERELRALGWELGAATVFDVCCGKGMTSCVAANSAEGCEVIALDRDRRMNMKHLASEPMIEFREMDAYDGGVDDLMRDARERGRVVVVAGVHLCGDLSRRATELFARWGDVLVLSPCCLVREVKPTKRKYGDFGYGLAAAAKRLGADSHDLWCRLLMANMPTHVGREFSPMCKTLFVDTAMMSEKNRFIVARRERPRAERCLECA